MCVLVTHIWAETVNGVGGGTLPSGEWSKWPSVAAPNDTCHTYLTMLSARWLLSCLSSSRNETRYQ